ncbi:MAG TPA: ATP synthase F0 subunit B [Geobacteraceae bacterium]|nr:ATP synthase F0 subunit B [Geobacteraceae bacterium]
MKSSHGKRLNCLNLVTASVLLLGIVLAASSGFASETAHHVDTAAQLKDFLYRLFNFALLAGILIWAMKKADVKGLLAARREEVAKVLRDAEEIREEAERKLAEYTEKLEKANREIDDIRAAIKQEGEAEKARIIAEAKDAAERIRQQAEVSANQEIQQARVRLQAETARLAVQLAQSTLKQSVTQDDQDRFVDEYLKKVVEG